MNVSFEQRLAHKAKVLEVLGPLGFVDLEDDEALGAIYHPATMEVYDVSTITPEAVITLVYQRGAQHGAEEAKRRMRESMGL